MAALKQLSTIDNSKGIDIKEPNTQHPKAKAFMLAQVPADEQMITTLAETDLASEMYVLDQIKDIPSHYPSTVKTSIQNWLKENHFDDVDNDVCIISPFIPNLRGFIVEIFDRDYAEHYSHAIASKTSIKVKGLYTIIEDTLDEIEDVVSTGDSAAISKVKKLKDKEAIENQQAVEKAKIINKRLWWEKILT